MHRLLLPATFVGAGQFQGKLYDLGTYPAAVASDDPADVVHGEVYRLSTPANTLAALDRYEGCSADDPGPHEYVRIVTDIRLSTAGHPVIPAQIYVWNRAVIGLMPIKHGDYLAWLAERFSASGGA